MSAASALGITLTDPPPRAANLNVYAEFRIAGMGTGLDNRGNGMIASKRPKGTNTERHWCLRITSMLAHSWVCNFIVLTNLALA